MIGVRAVVWPSVVALVFALAVAACGGGDGEAGADEAETTIEDTQAPATEASESETDAAVSAPAPIPGQAVVALDDQRVLEVEVRSCTIDPNGTFQVNGGDAAFTMAQLILGDQWNQTQAELELPNGNSVYAIASGATEGAEQATVEGKHISWAADTFRELDPAANRHVYEGQGIVQVACP